MDEHTTNSGADLATVGSTIQDHTFRGHMRASIVLGVPLVGAQLAQMLISVVDTIMLGWLGVEELAAGTLAFQLFFIFLIFGLGFGTAIIPLVSGALGRVEKGGDIREVRRSARMGLWVLAGISTAFMLPLWFAEEILLLLGQDDELAALAGRYMVIAQWSLIPAFLMLGLRSFLTSLELAQIVMWFTFATALLNGLLNYIFIFGNFGAPRLEMEGAAIATLLSNLFALSITALFVWRHKSSRQYQVFSRLWVPDWQAFGQILRLGFPISLTILAEAGLFAASTIMMGWVSTVALAAHGVALQIASLAFMIPLGLAQVATVRVGRAVGRADVVGMGRAGWAAILLAFCFALVSAFTFIAIPEPLVVLFLDMTSDNAAAVVLYATILLAMAALFQVVDGLQAVAAGALRGMSDTTVPMIIAAISYWPVGLTAAWVFAFPLGFEGAGIWAGLALGLTCAAYFLMRRFYYKTRSA